MSNLGWFTSSDKLGIPDLWTPVMIETDLWLDAADAYSITLNGSAVSQWSDKSGNSNHATQTSAGSQPTRVVNGIQFNGTSHFLNAPALFSGTTARSLFVVGQFARTQGTLFAQGDASTNGAQWNAQVSRTTAGSLDLHSYGGIETTSDVYSSSSVGLFFYCNPESCASNDIILRYNGSSDIATAAESNPSINTGNSTSRIGNRITTNAYLSGIIYEIIAMRRLLTSIERQKIEGYLAHKWGFAA